MLLEKWLVWCASSANDVESCCREGSRKPCAAENGPWSALRLALEVSHVSMPWRGLAELPGMQEMTLVCEARPLDPRGSDEAAPRRRWSIHGAARLHSLRSRRPPASLLGSARWQSDCGSSAFGHAVQMHGASSLETALPPHRLERHGALPRASGPGAWACQRPCSTG